LSVFLIPLEHFLNSLQRTSFSSTETIITGIVSGGEKIPPKRHISHREKKCLGKNWICVRGGDSGVGTMGGVYREHRKKKKEFFLITWENIGEKKEFFPATLGCRPGSSAPTLLYKIIVLPI
jgi:hypothetical protein